MLASRVALGATIGLLSCLVGCAGYPGVVITGQVEDWMGEPLPGVAVVGLPEKDGVLSGMSDPLGRFSLRARYIPEQLAFIKTGYTRHVLSLAEFHDTIRLRVPTVPRLWPIPAVEGVYLAEKGRYRTLDSARPTHYVVPDTGTASGLSVLPAMVLTESPLHGEIPSVWDPRGNSFLVGVRMPLGETRLWRLQRVMAASADSLAQRKRAGVKNARGGEAPAKKEDESLLQPAWLPESRVPVDLRPVDEPDNNLFVIIPREALTPGVYAVDWGSLLDTGVLEQRVFLFAVADPQTGAIPEPEKTEEELKREELREQQRQQRRKEMDKATNEGMG